MLRSKAFWIIVVLICFFVAPTDMTQLVQNLFHALATIFANFHLH